VDCGFIPKIPRVSYAKCPGRRGISWPGPLDPKLRDNIRSWLTPTGTRRPPSDGGSMVRIRCNYTQLPVTRSEIHGQDWSREVVSRHLITTVQWWIYGPGPNSPDLISTVVTKINGRAPVFYLPTYCLAAVLAGVRPHAPRRFPGYPNRRYTLSKKLLT
jgi:hypothetical protein